MPSNFDVSCQRARESIHVPAIPIDTIRLRAPQAKRPGRDRRRGLVAGLVAGLSIVAVAAATELLGARIAFDPHGPMRVYALSGAMAPHPTRADFETATARVNFPVILPVGLPSGTKATGLFRLAKSALIISYDLPGAWRRSNHVLQIAVADPRVVTTSDALPAIHMPMSFETGGSAGKGGQLWHIDGEDVIVLNSTMTTNELAHLKTAMTAAAATHSGNARAIAAVVSASAASAPVGTRVSFERDGTLRVTSDSMMRNDPCGTTETAMRECASHMAFPVVFPAGLPKGTKVTNFGLHDRHVAVIFYDVPESQRTSNHLLKVMIVDPSVIVASDPTFDQAKFAGRFPGARNAIRWTIGHEEIFFLRSTLTAAELSRVKNAMTQAAASQR
ncbi:MAG TPA: hypothetical protein VFN49_01430 [Candidatus Aquilonibacter sp.]|nr:hypothetical protein [Candidatus Aquilonibacter sp.]